MGLSRPSVAAADAAGWCAPIEPRRRACGTASVQALMRSRPTSTMTTSNRPIQNGQYCGVSAER